MRMATKDKVKDDLYRQRHSLAHVLAQAVLQVRPKAQLGFGPPTEHGFYYDFLFDTPITQDDLPEIEQRMRRIIKEKQTFERRLVAVDQAIEELRNQGATLKVEYAEELKNQGESELSFYINGPFTDMCEGPHVDKTSEIPLNCFKLDAVAGAYWRGDEKREMLTRIYGLAFQTKEELNAYLEQRKLAQERDHRKLGQELDLFVIDEAVGLGLPLWLPNGTVIREELEKLAKEVEFRGGYQRVATPHITKAGIYLTSGHLPHYQHDMFPPMVLEDEDEPYYLKPMNCPHHHRIFASRPRSYRDLPFRLAEYGQVYRFERHGALSGLLRVRGMSMNDAHIYCMPEQVEDEFARVLEMHRIYYEMFRLTDFWMRLSMHDENKDKYVANVDAWKESEAAIQRVLQKMDIRFEVGKGEAAFYGPKVDFQIKNVIGREETASTNQLDFAVPPRFGLTYIGSDGREHTPYCIHRAPLGTHERFISFLIEHFGGAFPTWMSPVQVRIVPVSDEVLEYAERLCETLRADLFRADVDASSESFNKRLRIAITRKIPNMLVVGRNEASDSTVTWRRYAVKEQKTLPFDTFKSILGQMRARRIMDNFPDVQLPER